MKKKIILIIFIIAAAFSVGLYLLYRTYFEPTGRTREVFEFLRDPDRHPEARLTALSRCGDSPFSMPTDGLIGFLWGDSFRIGHRHQGIDIFAGTEAGRSPVYAAYDGYLTRLPDWKSSVIIRIPEDPLQPDRQIWTYYTHMADVDGRSFIDEAFPAGTEDLFVTAGTLLGYQGNYSGTPGNPTGVHLHFSIIKDDGEGSFLNELEIRNTLDPSPYFGLALNAKENASSIPTCTAP
ncbi:MAG: M23 family metallopeptidase [Chloroflexota bacterium]|nr:M23 family metallopeptidase [Chloroflexota bacterium]